MMTLREIKAAIVAVLNQNFKGYKVHFDNVEKSDAPYFYVEFMPFPFQSSVHLKAYLVAAGFLEHIFSASFV